VLEVTTGAIRQITHGEGSNESPSFAANGRHLAFMSNRGGRFQIYTIARDGRDVRQVTRGGENKQPDWSK
jgi:TolB protein